MSITDVHAFDAPSVQLNYTHSNDMLSVVLDRVYVQDEQFNIVIAYNGRPQYSFYFDRYGQNPMIFTLSEPFGARAWWPCKDIPSDKADSVDIQATVPNNLIVASNGLLRETIPDSNKTTYWWHEQYPIVTYLVSLAIHPYEVYYDDYLYNNNADTMKIHFYTFPGYYDIYHSIDAKVKDMIACFANLFGEYPFIKEKYGHADCSPGGWAMEHQTCTSYAIWEEWVFAHELAHQWWGDMITCDSFHHIWLNEGFATYCEALWFEYADAPTPASEYQMNNNLYLGPGTVFVEDPQSQTIFDYGLSYQKGSWVLHMLRHVVGDSVFFDILKTYYASPKHQYGTATTEEFQAISEQVSGMDLDKFFHQWIYEEYFPRYSYSWDWIENGSNYEIQLEIHQEQDDHIFWMPIDITVETVEGEATFVVWDSLQLQSFQFSVSAKPILVELDNDNWILKQVLEPVISPTFDKGSLLVNGLSFEISASEVKSAYENRAFWGDFPISFWDCFDTPQEEYPSTLPEPLGHGSVPADILGQYSTVIWVGNDNGGDLEKWLLTSIRQYLKAGGNLILIAQLGQNFINSEMQEYLGITWAENSPARTRDCKATYIGLQDMSVTRAQIKNAVFDTSLTNKECTLLFKETASFDIPKGLGVWRKPTMGGTNRSGGGNFVFISGNPTRYNSDQLRQNVEFILERFLNEPTDVHAASKSSSINTYKLEQNYPNPFNPATAISYQLSAFSQVDVSIYNPLGQKVAALVSEKQPAGQYSVVWDATGFSAGVYFCRMEAGDPSTSSPNKSGQAGQRFVKVIKLALVK